VSDYNPAVGFELPPDKQRLLRMAMRIEWISIAYFATAVTGTALVMGQSQAMKTAWIDDMLGFIPPVAVLVADRLCQREPSRAYPYGLHRSVNIAFLVAAVALLGLGVALVFESVGSLLAGHHPTIGSVRLFGREIWLGWLMMVALVWSAVPSVFLGRIKVRLARQLHDKALHADAAMNRADWMTGGAAVLGVIGIGLGYWWADAAAATIIALDIVHDGFTNLRTVVGDLMDRRPRDVEDKRWESTPDDLERALERLPWVLGASVRMREHGHLLIGEAFVRPLDEKDPLQRTQEVRARARALDWRLQDLTVQLVGPDATDPLPR
jgi:cation diffusion facilitator family transporter